jgi:hypothetical protein
MFPFKNCGGKEFNMIGKFLDVGGNKNNNI